MSILPWRGLIANAHQMGLTPSQFWGLSVLEWRAVMGEGQSLDVTRLGELIDAFPDND